MEGNNKPANGQEVKNESCLNCRHALAESERYCPECGQKKMLKKLSLAELFSELVDVFLNLDSKFFRTLRDFLLKPGHLTNSFIRGQRVAYVHPLRLYLVSSVIYFFIFSISGGQEKILKLGGKGDKTILEGIDTLSGSLPDIKALENELKEARKKGNLQALIDSLDKEGAATGIGLLDSLDENDKSNVSGIAKEMMQGLDSADAGQLEMQFRESSDSDSLLSWDLTKLNVWMKNPDTSPESLLDSMKLEKSALSVKLAGQLLKIARHDTSVLIKAMIDNIPTMMFFVLPVYAFILTILYIRSKRYYIEHLIFTLHLHAFTFIMLAIASVVYEVFDYNILPLFIPGIMLYAFVMFIKVYRQGVIKTLFKCWIIVSVYSIVVAIFSVAEVIYSLLSL